MTFLGNDRLVIGRFIDKRLIATVTRDKVLILDRRLSSLAALEGGARFIAARVKAKLKLRYM